MERLAPSVSIALLEELAWERERRMTAEQLLREAQGLVRLLLQEADAQVAEMRLLNSELNRRFQESRKPAS
jgi:hypothetical protein